MTTLHRGQPSAPGFTLVEMLVVLVLLGLAVGLAVPSLRPPRSAVTGLDGLLPTAREAAIRRGETTYLRIAEAGEWRVEGASSAADGALASGRVDPFAGLPIAIAISPLGTCALDPSSAARMTGLPLDPLTCELRAAPRRRR